jgi:hypothetical protein
MRVNPVKSVDGVGNVEVCAKAHVAINIKRNATTKRAKAHLLQNEFPLKNCLSKESKRNTSSGQ